MNVPPRFDLQRSRLWDRQIEGDLPDCRLKYENRQDDVVVRGRIVFERVYCANCGNPGGAVTAGHTTFAFYLCDGCAEMLGGAPSDMRPSRNTKLTAAPSAGT